MLDRFKKLVDAGHISSLELEQFLLLEDLISSNHGEGWLKSFHHGEDYFRLLKKVLKGLLAIGEPKADLKLQAVIEEYGTMSPGLYMTPWELTLKDLDEGFR